MNDDVRQNLIEAKRSEINAEVEQDIAKQSLLDILDQVKETPKDAPDFHDPETFKVHFEKNNSHLGLYYTH